MKTSLALSFCFALLAGRMQSTDGERGRLDRSRRRPADGPAALAPANQRTKW